MSSVQAFDICRFHQAAIFFHAEIPHMDYRIIRAHNFVMPLDKGFVHFICCFKRPLAILNNVFVAEVFICRKKVHIYNPLKLFLTLKLIIVVMDIQATYTVDHNIKRLLLCRIFPNHLHGGLLEDVVEIFGLKSPSRLHGGAHEEA